jgi:hypothetical protein
MKQHQAVIEVMRARGGYATLGQLYQQVLRVPGVEWKTKTPFASIRRIVQDPRFFFKIRPGLWALNEFKDKIPFQPESKTAKAGQGGEFTHAYYQGLLVEVGNLRHFGTFVPNQDQNHKFVDKALGTMITVDPFYHFTYDQLVQRARTIDVTWFNTRNMPDSFFEVEHSTDIYNSLLKFDELQDFNANFRIVADRSRQREFQSKLAIDAFRDIAPRVKFISYETVSELHAKTYELSLVESTL